MTTPQALPQPPKPSPRPPSRMTLSGVVKGKQAAPIRVLIYGDEGCGKSTFGAAAPSPIFLGAEDGTAQIDCVRFPTPETWEDVMDAVRILGTEEHEYKTLVVDTLDWAEPLLWAYIVKRDSTAKNPLKSIEDYGYGKGYQAALDEWRVFLAAIEKARRARGMHVVLIAHSWVKAFKNPDGEDFDRYEMKLNPKASGLIKEWADAVLFARYETLVAKDSRTKRTKGIDTGARLLYTERRAAYDAKNRYGLPESLPLSWADFEAATQAHQPADPRALTEELTRKAGVLGGRAVEDVAAAIRRAGGDAQKLAILNNWLNAEISKREQ